MGVISRLILITHRKNFQVIRAEGVAREMGEREARHFWRAQAGVHLHSIRCMISIRTSLLRIQILSLRDQIQDALGQWDAKIPKRTETTARNLPKRSKRTQKIDLFLVSLSLLSHVA